MKPKKSTFTPATSGYAEITLYKYKDEKNKRSRIKLLNQKVKNKTVA
jgi:hypothetical protein